MQQTVPVVPISAAYRRRHHLLPRKNGEPTLLAGFVGAVESVTLELNRHGGIHLVHLLLRALGAHGNRVVIERLLFGEVIAAVLATVMIGRQRIPPTKSYFSRMACNTMPCNRSYPSRRPDTLALRSYWPACCCHSGSIGQCAWPVGQSGLRRVSWPAGQLNRPDELSRRYPSGVSTPSAGTSCGSAGKSVSNTSHGQHTAIRGHAGLR